MTDEDTGVSGFSGDRGDVRGNQLVEAPDFLGCSGGFWSFNPIGPEISWDRGDILERMRMGP
ncbi:unnamed protein product [Prunus armeniaca]|uniref:Uncharacterized protein n=1 Tax=Prunus armeniaca TaxID=36596 RepID=A0A6J5Y3T1_PRUAR|nr:unnamed protein product [Prunus armeniaca]